MIDMIKEEVMLVYLIRHGQTELNKKKMLQGQSDIELNDCGRKLAEVTGEGMRGVAFDLAFSSPLIRAKETAQLVLGGRDIHIVEDKRIQEISFGEYEGLCYHKDYYNIPDKSFLNFFQAPEKYNTPPQGESFEEIIRRTGGFWQDLIGRQEYADKTILISTHGCALKAILANIRNTPISQFWGEGVHKNCAVTLVEVCDGAAKVIEEGKIYYKENE